MPDTPSRIAKKYLPCLMKGVAQNKTRMLLKVMIKWPYIFTLVLFVLSACAREEEFAGAVVDPSLQPLFDRFVAEGQQRGRTVDMSRISGVVADIPETKVLGRCAQGAISGSTLTVDAAFWNSAGNWEKEYVVFHELGHCALNRRHLEDQKADGACKSIMQSGTTGCKMIYNAQTRSGYLDELFSP